MKNIISFIIVIMLVNVCIAQDYTCYNKNKPERYNINTKSVFIASRTVNNTEAMANLIGDRFIIIKSNNDNIISNLVNKIDNTKSLNADDLFWVEAKLKDSTLSKTDYMDVVEQLKKIGVVDYVAPALSPDSDETVLLSYEFYVRLASQGDLSQLQAIASQTHTWIVGSVKAMPNWYVLHTDKSSMGNAIEMAKYFYETGKFQYTEPSLIGGAKTTSTASCSTLSDPLFSDQWNLNNTGQQSSDQVGFDIHACDAWGITTGDPSIIVGLVDIGPSYLHPDLSPNIVSGNGWDAVTGTAPSVQYANDPPDHGTATAGIIVAQQNDIGLSGVAPNCQLLPVSINFTSGHDDLVTSTAITHAYENGADVISNSWGGVGSWAMTDEAISNALTMGRPIDGGTGGYLGSVVVFSAGNNNDYHHSNGPVDHPAADNPDILVVGATSICQERKRFWRTGGPLGTTGTSCDDGEDWGSNYGTGLDIMAPGIRITTTDNQSDASTPGAYINNFDGTSAACPHAAGVAALILSLYPCLTQQQVTTMIEQSANKINTAKYNYQPTTGEPNGTWNNEMGYVFLDAYASLNQIVNFSYLQDDDVTGTEKHYSLNFIQAGYDVNPSTSATPGDYIIDNTANVEIKATQYIEFKPGFVTKPGAVMEAHIAPYTGDCTNWVPVFDKKPPTGAAVLVSNSDSTKSLTTDNVSDGITMFPNPFKNSFTVAFEVLTDNENTSVKVFDLTGRLLYQQSGIEPLGLHSYTIPVHASASLYMVEACMGGNCLTQKMVKYEEE